MKTIAAIAVGAVAAFFAIATVDTPAEAKKFKPAHAAKNVGKQAGKVARNAGRGVARSVRRGTDAIWVGTGLAAGHAAITNNCSHYYRRYQETGDRKWRNKYNACI